MNDTAPIKEDTPNSAITKMVDFRLPLYWILSGAGALLWALISMWFSLQQIKEDMTQLKAATVVAAASASKQALIEFRLSAMENDINQLKGARPPRN